MYISVFYNKIRTQEIFLIKKTLIRERMKVLYFIVSYSTGAGAKVGEFLIT